MLTKEYSPEESCSKVRVSFELPQSLWATSIHLIGDFNEWKEKLHPLHRDHDGNWRITIELEAGHSYEFRYLLDQHDYINEAHADGYVTNRFGCDNGLIMTEAMM